MQVSWVYILFTALVAVGVLLQGCVMLGMLIAVRSALKRAESLSKMAEEHVIPTMATAREILQDVSPKLRLAAQNVVEASQTVRVQTVHLNEELDQILKKAEAQIDRVDEMVTGTLNTVSHATATMQRAVAAPVRQANALWSGFRAGLDVLLSRERQNHSAADGDHFV